MKLKLVGCAMLLLLFTVLTMAAAQAGSGKDDSAAAASPQATEKDKAIRLEGEKRFHSNCSRCHTAPPKFPPRMMGTIVRHMRVRAMLTDDDMHFILRYMTQ